MSLTELQARERQFYDQHWALDAQRTVTGGLDPIPEVGDLAGKRLLICSCGSGVEPVRAAQAGAEVYAFDISETGVQTALAVARHNGVRVAAAVMPFEKLAYPDDFFDVMYGSSILHHVDCARVALEVRRCLKPGGVAYFLENSDRNPLVRLARRIAFGAPGELQRSRFLFFRRFGTFDEYPLTDREVAHFRRVFPDGFRIVHDEFVFVQLLYHFALRRPWFRTVTETIDELLVRAFPFLMRYSYDQHIWLRKPR